MEQKHSHKKIQRNFNQNSTSNLSEMLTEVDESDNVIGPVTRLECHNETRKPWHRGAHLFLFSQDGKLYLSQRSQNADTAPGQWTVSAGGHVKFNSDYKETIIEEAREKLGIEVSPFLIDKFAVDYGSEREVISIFAFVTDEVPKLSDEKLERIESFEFNTLIEDFVNGKFDLSGGSRDSFKHVIDNKKLIEFYEKNFPGSNS